MVLIIKKLLLASGLASLLSSPASAEDNWDFGISGSYRNLRLGEEVQSFYGEINRPLDNFFDDFQRISPTDNFFDLSLSARHSYPLNETVGIGPIFKVSLFGGGSREYSEDYDVNLPGTEVLLGETDINFTSHLNWYLNVSAGVFSYLQPADWLRINWAVEFGLAHIDTQTIFSQRLNAEESILEAARQAGKATRIYSETDSVGTGFSLNINGGPEFLFSDFGIFINSGFIYEVINLHRTTHNFREGNLDEIIEKDIELDASGPFIELGLRYYF